MAKLNIVASCGEYKVCPIRLAIRLAHNCDNFIKHMEHGNMTLKAILTEDLVGVRRPVARKYAPSLVKNWGGIAAFGSHR